MSVIKLWKWNPLSLNSLSIPFYTDYDITISNEEYQVLDNSPECGKLSLNKEECQEAAQKLGLSFKAMNKGVAPNACFLDSKLGQFRTWWNAHPGSYGKVKYTSICKKTAKESNGRTKIQSIKQLFYSSSLFHQLAALSSLPPSFPFNIIISILQKITRPSVMEVSP